MQNQNRNLLFVVPNEHEIYRNVNVGSGAIHLPSLALAILVAIAKKNGYIPSLLDLTFEEYPYERLRQCLREEVPKYVGISCTTATYYQAVNIARIVKEVSSDIKILVGGPHVSSLVEETVGEGYFDYVFVGEADISFDAFLKGVDLKTIDGIAFKDAKNGDVHYRANKSFIRNIDSLVVPDYTLYDLSRYRLSRHYARNNPAVWIETSRGCPFDCQICNKVVHGQTFRPKSAQRVVEEMEFLLRVGIKEFHIADDGFSNDMKRAEDICDQIIRKGLVFSWVCANGIRADRVNAVLLKKMKLAGCYRISFGIDSGSQKVLDSIRKGIRIGQIRKAITLAKEADLEVCGFFIFGHEEDSEETMMDTIRFARSLPLDLVKASIMVPFPGSPLFEKYKLKKLICPIKDNYKHFTEDIPLDLVYRHPSLQWALVEKYKDRFNRSFYLNPVYIIRRCRHAFKNGTLLSDLGIALQMDWFRGNNYSRVLAFFIKPFSRGCFKKDKA